MRVTTCLFLFFFCLFVSSLVAQETEWERKDFVSDASFIVGTYSPSESDHSPASMAKAAKDFLATLNAQQRESAMHAIDSRERREWTNLPAREDAGGIRFGQLDEKQAKAACDLLAAMFSEQGYQKMVSIMLADDQLIKGRARVGFGTEYFSIVVFGEPSETNPWCVQLDGHHVGVNVSVTGDKLTMSPSFIGTQPQWYDLGGKKMRPLTGEIDDAYKLVGLLSDEQRKAAVVGRQRGDLVAGPGRDNVIPEPVGVDVANFDEEQKRVLKRLIAQWVNDLPERHAAGRMVVIENEMAEMKFSWNGEIEEGSDISYRIQSPSLIIEYACQSLGGDPQQHLHTMYRNPKNEYLLQIPEQVN